MKEPTRLSMSTGLPHQPDIKKIPLPSIKREQERSNGFWEFVAQHEKSREKWLKQKQENENNTEGDQT